ncbi:bolA-like protein 2 [Bombyx mandarina]|uniref:BolA-like protein 2 n=1 Tax=Bombyx mandarina TaxID=7092 RepID=A0A6J2JIV6_BOMMA|nr:bolA-like protein 2 [Bombyx mandarina]
MNMVYTEKYLKEKLTQELDAVHVEVTDESDGCGAKFSVLIVSDKFKGKPLLARHRLVNTLLQEELKTIHAFTQKTLTVDQWKTQ